MRTLFMLFLFFPPLAFAQKIYSPTGKEIKLPAGVNTSDKIYSYLRPPGPKSYTYRVEGYTDDSTAAITFIFLTDKAVFVSCTHPERIKEYIDLFDFDSFLNSPAFETEVKKHIAIRDLPGSYVTDKLGEPDAQTRDENGDIITETYDYTKCSCTLVITNGVVTRFLAVKPVENN